MQVICLAIHIYLQTSLNNVAKCNLFVSPPLGNDNSVLNVRAALRKDVTEFFYPNSKKPPFAKTVTDMGFH